MRTALAQTAPAAQIVPARDAPADVLAASKIKTPLLRLKSGVFHRSGTRRIMKVALRDSIAYYFSTDSEIGSDS